MRLDFNKKRSSKTHNIQIFGEPRAFDTPYMDASNKVSEWLHRIEHPGADHPTAEQRPNKRIINNDCPNAETSSTTVVIVSAKNQRAFSTAAAAGAATTNDDATITGSRSESSVDTTKYIKSNRTITRTKRKTLKQLRSIAFAAAFATIVEEEKKRTAAATTTTRTTTVADNRKRHYPNLSVQIKPRKKRIRYNAQLLKEAMCSSSSSSSSSSSTTSSNNDVTENRTNRLKRRFAKRREKTTGGRSKRSCEEV